MKKLLCAALSAAMLTATLVSCQSAVPKFSPKISVTSSDAEEYATWLTNRLGTVSEKLTLGTSDSAGIDMTYFENDGYVIRSRGDETVISGKTGEGLDLAVRKYAKSASKGVGCEDTVYHEGYRIEKLTIADVDISEYTVFYSPDANENMKFAVAEFQRLVKKACGADLKAVQGEPTGNYIIEFKHDTDPELRFDGYRYRVDGTHLTFEGAVKRGCMYAVWRFLQNECGWDGLIYGDSILAEVEHINIPDGLTKSEVPAFDSLTLATSYSTAEFANDRRIPSPYQNSYGTISYACHGIKNYCDVDLMEEQICYTSEERYEECIGNIRKFIKTKLDSGFVLGESLLDIDIAQCDNGNYCTCEECRRVFEEEGGNSGAVVRFANRLSQELNEEYPGIVYKIFAYMGTNIAPKVTKPNDLVYVTFCYDHNCTNHTVDGTECNPDYFSDNVRTNDVFADWLKGWSDITHNIYVWFYTLDTGLLAYSTLGNILSDFQYFNEMGVVGIIYEAEHFSELNVEPIAYQLISELNWNIEMTEAEYEALLCRTLEKRYGDGWSDIRSYISIWEESQNQAPCWHCWGWQWTFCDVPRFSTAYYGEHLEESIELVENALRLVNSKLQERYAELFTCHVYYSGCYSLYYAAEDSGDRATIKKLNGYYDKTMDILFKYGFDPVGKGIMTLSTADNFRLKYSQRLAGAAIYDWIYCKDFLMYHEYWDENPFYQ